MRQILLWTPKAFRLKNQSSRFESAGQGIECMLLQQHAVACKVSVGALPAKPRLGLDMLAAVCDFCADYHSSCSSKTSCTDIRGTGTTLSSIHAPHTQLTLS